jgi:hypothetical protein
MKIQTKDLQMLQERTLQIISSHLSNSSAVMYQLSYGAALSQHQYRISNIGTPRPSFVLCQAEPIPCGKRNETT